MVINLEQPCNLQVCLVLSILTKALNSTAKSLTCRFLGFRFKTCTYQSLTMLVCHVQSEGLIHPLSKVEMPLVRVLASMEHTRMAINVQILENQK